MEKDGPTFPGDPTFPRGRGSNCIFLYKPIEFVIFQGAGARTPAPSFGSARGIVYWVRPHIVWPRFYNTYRIGEQPWIAQGST